MGLLEILWMRTWRDEPGLNFFRMVMGGGKLKWREEKKLEVVWVSYCHNNSL